jgi:ABC-type nickel/cobalt efflux system permease component RcnA
VEAESRRWNPWPWGLAIALALMIGASLTVLGIAIAKPDTRVVAHPLAVDGDAPRPAD